MDNMSALDLLLTRHFLTGLLILVCGIKLYSQKKAKDAELRYFWMTLICCALLVMQDVAESLAAQDPDLRFFRILFSVIGYVLRPVAAIGLLLVVCPPKHRTWRLWIPALVNLAINLTAFFSPIAFSYDQNYNFVRGPLGYSVFIVGMLYMAQILVATWHRFHERKRSERWILILCATACIVASVIDALYWGIRLNEAILISSVFFYMFLRSHDNRLDPLTSLENRFAFYEDIQRHPKSVSAIASLDMNGLKHINDTQGHTEGDRALAEIGRCLGRADSRNTIAYRIGGDEFLIVFLQQDKAAVEKTIARVREDVTQAGYSVSVGCAMRTGSESTDDLLHESDRKMYEDKAAYYRQSGMDRRRN